MCKNVCMYVQVVAKTQAVASKRIEAAGAVDKPSRSGSYVVAADAAEIVDLHGTLLHVTKNVSTNVLSQFVHEWQTFDSFRSGLKRRSNVHARKATKCPYFSAKGCIARNPQHVFPALSAITSN